MFRSLIKNDINVLNNFNKYISYSGVIFVLDLLHLQLNRFGILVLYLYLMQTMNPIIHMHITITEGSIMVLI